MTSTFEGEGKLGAYRDNGGTAWDTDPDASLLYLGAAEGVTAAWIADRVPRGDVVAVEKSPVASLGLVETAQERDNLVPYVGDARHPGTYAPVVPDVDLLYQDVAQRDQVDIFLDNAEAFQPRRGFLAVKARSIAVERPPEDVFDEARAQLDEHGDVVDVVRLDPHHRDHVMIVADFDGV